MSGIFPFVFGSEELRLLTAIVLGFLFGFSLERAGFGNARKLAAQFYGTDLTVFKVMFTAILVAMVGYYTVAGLGWVDPTLMWVNPTFLPAQVVGGFLLGAGFIMSGLCPGTSVVSAASGRWDAVVTMGGILVGTLVFVVAVEVFPALDALYHAGDMGVSVLPTLLGVPPMAFALGVVVVAGVAFVVAEKVEAHFAARAEALPLAPRARPRMKLQLAGALAIAAVLGIGAGFVPRAEATPPPLATIDPLTLAEDVIAGDADLMILDLRDGEPDAYLPGAYPAADPEMALQLLRSAPDGMRVVVFDARGTLERLPPEWPARLRYEALEGGFFGWEFQVLTPAPDASIRLTDRDWTERQRQISAYFTGAAVESSGGMAPPPAILGGNAGKKPKGGGC
ncbi:MAG TPA: YeeE/YedE thiosulfate transporter family protein [Longimicrobiales bacterium]|nr:YeeE/YedE thiosulfate transporter family protein [Longimicrobiales bacterium]